MDENPEYEAKRTAYLVISPGGAILGAHTDDFAAGQSARLNRALVVAVPIVADYTGDSGGWL